jgi:cytoskeleton-associated protein 5
MSLLGEIEQIKLDKIKEYADKTILLNLKGEPRVQQQQKQQTVVVPAPVVVEEKKKPTITKPAPATTAAKKEESGKKKVVVKSGDKKQPNVEKEESELSQETVDDKSIDLFTQEVCTALGNSNWKDRLQSCETILNAVKRMPSDEVPTQIVVRLLGKKPGYKDSHFQVAKIKFDIILHLAQETKFTQRSAQYCVADIADKIGDVKLSEQSKNTLSKIGEAIGLSTLWPQVVGPIFEVQKSPKNQENALLWLSQAIKEFSNQGIDMKSLVVQLKAGLANSNPSVRSATIQLIGTLYLFIGPQIRVLFESEKAALLEQIDTEIGKYKDQKAPAPIRFKKGCTSVKTDDASSNEEETQSEPQDLMPRVDISDKLTEELMTQLNDKNWKERQAGLEKIEGILKEAKFIVANLNDFPTHLNKRLVDSNKVISQNSLRICEKLAETMGINGKKYCSTLASGMIQALTDSKEALRKMAIATLNSWFTHCGGLAPFLEGETLVESFATSNPNLKTELCNWLASVLPKSKKLPPELKALISPLYTCLEDRNADVRAAAQSLIEPLMSHVGPNEMLRVMGKAKPSSVTVIQPIIDKARADLAAKQPAAPPPPPAPVQSSAAPTKAAATTKQQPATKASTLTSTKSSDKLATVKQHDVSMDGDDDNKKVAGKNSKVSFNKNF